MNRYVMVLGVAIMVFSIAGGSIEISASYSRYQARFRVTGAPDSNPLTVLDEARWQFGRLVGGTVIAVGVISGSMLMALGWIGRTMEQIRDALEGELAELPAKPSEASAAARN